MNAILGYQIILNVLFIGAVCLGILSSCSPSEKAKDTATETVRSAMHAERFLRDTYDKLIVADAHGEVIPEDVFIVTVTITNVSANRESVGTDISLKGTLWAGSKVTANCVFAQSEFEYVAARKPGEVVTLKCKLNGVSSNAVNFIGAVAHPESNTKWKTNG